MSRYTLWTKINLTQLALLKFGEENLLFPFVECFWACKMARDPSDLASQKYSIWLSAFLKGFLS